MNDMIEASATKPKSTTPPPTTSSADTAPEKPAESRPAKAPEPRPTDAEVEFSPQAQAELDAEPSPTDTDSSDPAAEAGTPEVADETSDVADETPDVADETQEIAAASDIEGVDELAQSGELEELLPPDFKLMTEEEQYAYLEEVVLDASGDNPDAWKVEPGEVNLVGIRSFQDGQPTTPEGDVYNDTIYAAWMDDQGEVHVEGFQASTDAGVVDNPEATGFGYSNSDGYQGLSHLADGFYQDTWTTGAVPQSDLGLRQSDDIRIHADANNDGIINPEERLGEDITGDGVGDGVTEGYGWGIQFHPGGSSERNVNLWSAGCQVIVDEQYEDFKEVLRNATNDKFSYTLVDSSNLPPVDAGQAAAPSAPTASPQPQIPSSTEPSTSTTSTPAEPSTSASTTSAPSTSAPSTSTPSTSTPSTSTPSTVAAAPAEAALFPDTQTSPATQPSPVATETPNAPVQASSPPSAPSQAPQAPPDSPLPTEFQQQVSQMLPGMTLPDNFNDLILFLLSQMNMAGPGMGGWGFARTQMSRAQLGPILQMVMQQAQASGVSLSVPALQRLNSAGIRPA